MRRFLPVLFLLLLPFQAQALSFDLTFSADEIRDKVGQAMPLVRDYKGVGVSLAQPSVTLDGQTQEIAVGAVGTALVSGMPLGSFTAAVAGKLRFDAEQGAFYLDQPRLAEFHSPGLSPLYEKTVKVVAGALLTDWLTKHPIYTLKEDSLKEKLLKATLEEVVVEDGQLRVRLKLM
ncbi:MAG: hypothetical protein COX57_00475 [Alphaproteobacteria bacterium CG_4_10_14_0_2_um_filter_63_37]|nr:MAG: hypothetical protein AUJ55_05585 [Proteobacteria bacterium CG1_02_64_396]PJA26022.1 MAG: hypothetical protein COX57_00475 [Alphaproteobacteria bacterium CG_4_10_14_0_2_um_filter_63_37]